MADVKAPGHLTPAAQEFWQATADNYSLEPHHLHLLTACCEAWDRMNGARTILADEGVTYRNRFGDPCKHPAVAIEQDARTAFMRALRELDLDGEPTPDPRIPRRK
jgi:P27 family predicted phage terminase small subunit